MNIGPALSIRHTIWKQLNDFYSWLEIDYVSGQSIKLAADFEKLGSSYGGWIIPTSLMTEQSVCYCTGAGEDVSFDMGLMDRLGCLVFAFDPTPRAIKYVEINASDYPQYNFNAVGLWDRNEELKFYTPKNPNHVSHSILNVQKTNDFFYWDLPQALFDHGGKWPFANRSVNIGHRRG